MKKILLTALVLLAAASVFAKKNKNFLNWLRPTLRPRATSLTSAR